MWGTVDAHEACVADEACVGESESTALVECLSTEHDGVMFAAGVIYVTIGNTPQQKGVGCLAGKERIVTTIEHAPTWLTEHGLPAETARALVADALEHVD